MFFVVVFLVVAYTGGITLLRQTRAIWYMNSSNAVSTNTTLNTYTFIEPLFIIVTIALIMIAVVTFSRFGFG